MSRGHPIVWSITVQRYADRLLCLGRTKHGHPRHPLYVRSDAVLVPLVERKP